MRNQVHPAPTNKLLNSPYAKAKSKHKAEVSFPKIPLF